MVVYAAASASPVATKGRIPDGAFLPSGQLDGRLVPDFVAVYGRDGESIAGYVPKAFLLRSNESAVSKQLPVLPDIPVYGDDLETVVGHMVSGKGFVPLSVDPATIPYRNVEQGPSD